MKPNEPTKIAIFKCIEPDGALDGYTTIGREEYERFGTYVRISEYAELTFAPLKNDEVIQGALRALDAAELKAREALQRTLDQISNQRASLLALTHQSAPLDA